MDEDVPDPVQKYGDLAMKDIAAIFSHGEDSAQVFYMICSGYGRQELLEESGFEGEQLSDYVDELEERKLVERREGSEDSYRLLPKGEFFRKGFGELLEGYGSFASETLFNRFKIDPGKEEDIDRLRNYRETVSEPAAEVIDDAIKWAESLEDRGESTESVSDAIDRAYEDL